MKSYWIIYILVIFSIVVLIFSCGEELTDMRPPDEVSGLKAEEAINMITLTWNDPGNADFDKVEISWLAQIIQIDKGIESFVIDDLINDTTYTILLKTMDFSKNRSMGKEVQVQVKAPPQLRWDSDPITELEYSWQGYPNQNFITTREFTNIGSFGIITFHIKIKDLATNDIIEESDRSFQVSPNQASNFIFSGKGDITTFNCTTCNTAIANYVVEFSCNYNEEVFFVATALCDDIPVCGNGNSNRETTWNSIWISYVEVISL